jgi:hypothetical protein
MLPQRDMPICHLRKTLNLGELAAIMRSYVRLESAWLDQIERATALEAPTSQLA